MTQRNPEMPCRLKGDHCLEVYSIYCGMQGVTEYRDGTENSGIGPNFLTVFRGREKKGVRVDQGVISMGK